jgi:hypothetical protein
VVRQGVVDLDVNGAGFRPRRRSVFPGIATACRAPHIAVMGDDGEYVYSVESGSAGAGRRVWRWSIRQAGSPAVIHQGTSIKSGEDAKDAALAVIGRLQRERDAGSK